MSNKSADQSPKVLHLFDAETGAVDSRTLASIESEKLDQAIMHANDVKQMSETRGWKFIEKTLTETIDGLKGNILEEEDLEKLRRHQAIARAYSTVLGLVKFTISEGESLQQYRTETSLED